MHMCMYIQFHQDSAENSIRRIYIYISIYTYIYIYVYTLRTRPYIYIYRYMHVYKYMHICVYIYACMYNSKKTVSPVAGEIKDISKVNLNQTVPRKTKFIVFLFLERQNSLCSCSWKDKFHRVPEFGKPNSAARANILMCHGAHVEDARTSHGRCMNESSRIYEQGVSYTHEHCHTNERVMSHTYEQCDTRERV